MCACVCHESFYIAFFWWCFVFFSVFVLTLRFARRYLKRIIVHSNLFNWWCVPMHYQPQMINTARKKMTKNKIKHAEGEENEDFFDRSPIFQQVKMCKERSVALVCIIPRRSDYFVKITTIKWNELPSLTVSVPLYGSACMHYNYLYLSGMFVDERQSDRTVCVCVCLR